MPNKKIPIAIARGDGIGPEIMEAVLSILKETGAPLDYQEVVIGEKVYNAKNPTGIEPSTWQVLKNTRAFLKAPITTHQGKGFKSVNVNIRTTFNLYANIRPCESFYPFVPTKHPQMDVIILRENEEDLYCGLEYQQTSQVTHAIKLISVPGSEKIIRFAYEFAKLMNRKKVSCFTKDNILKLTDGLFHKIYDQVSQDYPEIAAEHWIIDIGSAKLADTPEMFDMIVLPNLYGDILSDVAAQISGSVGMAGSANIGEHYAMFEALHGSAPKRAGQNVANPSGLLRAAILMLVYLGETNAASAIHNAWLKTLEEGIHTYDIYQETISKKKVSTSAFTQAILQNLGKKPSQLKAVSYPPIDTIQVKWTPKQQEEKKKLLGVDIFVEIKSPLIEMLPSLTKIQTDSLHLAAIYNRGVKIWPEGHLETFCVDQYCLRFLGSSLRETSFSYILQLLQILEKQNLNILRLETLYSFSEKLGFFT